MFAYCRGQSMVVHGRSSGSCGLCTPLQSKTIQNSRVLGYGRLNGHVASIVSMFSNESFETKRVPARYWKGELCTCEVRMMESRKLFYKKFCKEKYSFLQTIFIKPRGYVISTRETIIFLKYLFQQRYRYVDQP